MIDARTKLHEENFKKFYDSIESEVTLNINQNMSVIKKNELLYFIFSHKQLNLDPNLVISIKSENDEIEFLVGDLNWWNANLRRVNKIIKYCTEKQTKSTKIKSVEEIKTYYVAIAILKEKKLEHILSTHGTKDEIIQFLNRGIIELLCDASFNVNQLVLNLCYDMTKDYTNDLSDWHNIYELEKIGAIKLK